MKRVLVIGGEGYIGTVLCPYLLRQGNSVRSFDALVYGNHSNVIANTAYGSSYEFVRGDMRVREQVRDAMEGVDSVVLLAGLVGDPITKKYPRESASINDDGVQNVIDLAIESKVNHIVFVSTCSNYGLIPTDNLADENWPTNPLSAYARSKISAEQYLLSLGMEEKTAVTILRFATAFGLSPRMRFDLTISEFVREIYLGNKLTVYDADTWRPYCHVNDFARLIHIVLFVEKSSVANQVFNAGGTINNFTKKMVVDLVIQRIEDGEVYYQEHGHDPRNYRVDFSKIEKILGFRPEYTVENGVDELLWALKRDLFDLDSPAATKYGNYTLNSRFLLP
jgi:nucleoside-diphosphate-sugar epimerase